jgi:hypothetical protein
MTAASARAVSAGATDAIAATGGTRAAEGMGAGGACGACGADLDTAAADGGGPGSTPCSANAKPRATPSAMIVTPPAMYAPRLGTVGRVSGVCIGANGVGGRSGRSVVRVRGAGVVVSPLAVSSGTVDPTAGPLGIGGAGSKYRGVPVSGGNVSANASGVARGIDCPRSARASASLIIFAVGKRFVRSRAHTRASHASTCVGMLGLMADGTGGPSLHIAIVRAPIVGPSNGRVPVIAS